MINWRHPLKERPKVGQCIAYVDWHWKQQPASYHILSGYYREADNGEAMVCEEDEHGGGSAYNEWPISEAHMGNCDLVGAWVPIEEIGFPIWLMPKEGK